MSQYIILQETRVGVPRKIGSDGERLWSSIHKHRVHDPQLYLTPLQLPGDTVTHTGIDPATGKQLHGGPDRAVYAFPWEQHEPALKKLVGPLDFRGRVGENLRVAGVDETTVHVGDIWKWGDALLQVTGPRIPGPTLRIYFGAPVDETMIRLGMCGWFLRVVRPGLVHVVDKKIKMVERQDGSPTIAEELCRLVETGV